MELVNFDSLDNDTLNKVKRLTDSVKASLPADKIYSFKDQPFKKYWDFTGSDTYDKILEILKCKMLPSSVYRIVLEEVFPCEHKLKQVFHSHVSRINGVPDEEPTSEAGLPDGGGTFLWHQDENQIDLSFKTFLYLNDSNKDNGCICLAQGRPMSNFSSLFNRLSDIKPEYIEGNAGALITFCTRILHRQHLPIVNTRETLQFYRKIEEKFINV